MTVMNNVVVTTNDDWNYWEVPIESSTVDTRFFVVQAEGYGPTTNVFSPCPEGWDLGVPNVGDNIHRLGLGREDKAKVRLELE